MKATIRQRFNKARNSYNLIFQMTAVLQAWKRFA